MQKIFEVANTDLGDLFTQTALKMGMGLPSIIEKDYWLVKILQLMKYSLKVPCSLDRLILKEHSGRKSRYCTCWHTSQKINRYKLV